MDRAIRNVIDDLVNAAEGHARDVACTAKVQAMLICEEAAKVQDSVLGRDQPRAAYAAQKLREAAAEIGKRLT